MAMDISEAGSLVSGPDWSTYKPTGTHINYYFICRRKLWLFSHGVQMEQTSDTVLLGKLIDESSYERKDKGIDMDGTIVIDWIDNRTGVLHEVKKSDSMEDAHKWQVLYYLWYLKQKGVTGVKGEIDYPKLKQKVEVTLTPDSETKLLEVMKDAESIAGQALPPDRINKKFCKTCSYFELCWANQ
jgi:CRISPR-associated exonuclease Cas4